jgi:receptor protein-tyrosine kinase
MLRAHLRYFNVDRELKTLLVTSAHPAEGKTTIACSLATAAASMGTQTLLIEADLRKPRLQASLELQPGPGLADALVGAAPLAQAIQHLVVETGTDYGAQSHGLDVLEAGAVPPNPAELLESRAMVDLLAWAREHYGLVVIDTAPLAMVADAIPVMDNVDGVIVVARLGLTTRGASTHMRERLGKLGAPTLGLVINDVRASANSYGYGYTYGDAQDPDLSISASPDNSPEFGRFGSRNGADAVHIGGDGLSPGSDPR